MIETPYTAPDGQRYTARIELQRVPPEDAWAHLGRLEPAYWVTFTGSARYRTAAASELIEVGDLDALFRKAVKGTLGYLPTYLK